MMIADVTSKARRHKPRKRVGRGIGSGWGKTATRGHKGKGQHGGKNPPLLSEGGQMPLFRLLPKRGFSNARFRTQYQVVNVGDLQELFEEGAKISPAALHDAGLIHDTSRPVKVLGDGDLSKKFEIEANQFSASAAKKIADAGGQARTIE